MRAKHPAKQPPKALRRVRWSPDIVPWAIGVGMLVGFGEEIYWHQNNMLWMSGGAITGGIVGALCDTGLFLHRRFKAKRAYAMQQRSQSGVRGAHK